MLQLARATPPLCMLRASFIDFGGCGVGTGVGWWWARCCSLLSLSESAQRIFACVSRHFSPYPLDSLFCATSALRPLVASHNTCSEDKSRSPGRGIPSGPSLSSPSDAPKRRWNIHGRLGDKRKRRARGAGIIISRCSGDRPGGLTPDAPRATAQRTG